MLVYITHCDVYSDNRSDLECFYIVYAVYYKYIMTNKYITSCFNEQFTKLSSNGLSSRGTALGISITFELIELIHA